MRAKQATVDSINTSYDQLTRDFAPQSLSQPLQDKVTRLNQDWAVVKDLADKLEPTPEDTSIHEVFTQGEQLWRTMV